MLTILMGDDMSRIKLTDSTMDAMTKMADGNPGALMAIMDIVENYSDIDPQSAMGALGAIMILDTWEIYGSSIYVLWSDKCGKDVRRMLMIMRATQLGLFNQTRLQQMADDQAGQINLTGEEWENLDSAVCEQLTEFKRPS
jgi:hypothetical protein